MNSEEQTLIDGLFSRLQQAETDSAPRDAQAEARIKEHLTRQPAAGYFMTQAILVQEAALNSLDEQNKQLAQQNQQLQAELQQAKAQAAPAPRVRGGIDTEHRFVLPGELHALGDVLGRFVRVQGLVRGLGPSIVHRRARASRQQGNGQRHHQNSHCIHS